MKIQFEPFKKALKERQALVRIVLGMIILGNAAIYQNCSQVQFAGEAGGAKVDSSSTGTGGGELGTPRITINNGADYTNDMTVLLGLESQNATEMYVTNTPGCASGGNWEPLKATRTWLLKDSNTTNHVYGKFRNANGATTLCIYASIVQDSLAPTVQFVSTPNPITNETTSRFSIRGDDGNGSGVDHFICHKDQDVAVKCNEAFQYDNMTDGRHTTYVQAVDRAGNMSAVVEFSWLIDTIKPVIQIVDPKPPKNSGNTTVTFHFEAQDPNGSGVDHEMCQWDNQAPAACRNIDTRMNIPPGAHTFQVVAYDSAGNISDPAVYQWTIDATVPGAFQIVGITGGSDITPDHFLASVANPTITWTKSQNAVSYRVTILNAQNQIVCAEKSATQLSYGYAMADCQLQDGAHYLARVVAVEMYNNTTTAPLFDFAVDLSGPIIVVNPPTVSDDQSTAKVTFTVTDATSGVQTSTCYRRFGANTETIPCDGKTSLTFNDLPVGDHQFWIEATDKVGNHSVSTPIIIPIKSVVCDPFSANPNGTCIKGLVGEIYYQPNMPADHTQALKVGWTDVNTYITKGVKANAILFLSQLNLGTLNFDRGFPTADGTVIRDNQGNKLFEWFAIQLTSVIRLLPNDVDGSYQFALLSDDGTRLAMKDGSAATYNLIIDNNTNGNQATKMGCTTQAIPMTQASRKAIRLQYYEGPRYSIALQLLYRKAPTNNAVDPLCGREQDLVGKPNDGYFSKDSGSGGSTPGPWMTELSSRGWKVLSPDNYVTQSNP